MTESQTRLRSVLGRESQTRPAGDPSLAGIRMDCFDLAQSRNWVALHIKRDSEPHSDQGVYAGNGYAETNIRHDALRLGLDLSAGHLHFSTQLPSPK